MVASRIASRFADDWKEAYEHKEQHLIDLFADRHSGLFLDIGAHAGRWTIPLASNFRAIAAFEPNPYSAQALSDNLEKAGISNATIWTVGAARKSEMRILNELDGVPSRSTAYPEFSALPVTRRFMASFIALDDHFQKASLLKIDTEGSEADVLNGARRLLTKGTMLCVETHSDALYERCESILRKIGLDHRTMTLEEEAPRSLHAKRNQKRKYLVNTHE